MKPVALKPQDIVVAAQLACGAGWNSYERLAEQLEMSSQTVFEAVKRLTHARLFNSVRKRVVKESLLEFLEHGIRYAFPVSPVRKVRGIPTGVVAPVLAERIRAGDESAVVWPSRAGHMLGQEVPPLHKNVPEVAAKNPTLYDLLALIDAVRVGGAREREVALRELRKRLS